MLYNNAHYPCTCMYTEYVYWTCFILSSFTLVFVGLAQLSKNPKFQAILQRKMREFNLRAPYERFIHDVHVHVHPCIGIIYIIHIHTYTCVHTHTYMYIHLCTCIYKM